jgi:hypothetical protein
MARRWRTIVRLVIVSLLLLPGAASFAPASHENPGQCRTDVRLRKLHLVRPDLIPYPVFYDVFC